MKLMITFALGAALLGSVAQAQPEAGGGPPPPGDFWASCHNVSTYGYGENITVTAECRDERGRWQFSSVRAGRCRALENRDGQLACRDEDRPVWEGDREVGRRPAYGGSVLVLFSAPDFAGAPFETRAEVTNLPKQFNDHAMSLRIQGRGAWEVCADSDFQGRCQIFDHDVRDLRAFGLGEAVTSMRPVR